MPPVHYRPGRLVGYAIAATLFGGLTLWLSDDWFNLSLGTLLLVAGLFAGSTAFDTRPALLADPSGLTVRTIFGCTTVKWNDVLVVTIELRKNLVGGIFPLSRRKYLSIMVPGGAIGSKRLRLQASFLSLPPGGIEQVREKLLAARAAAGVTTSAQEARGIGRGDFDADAAIARYMEAKRAAPIAATPAPLAKPEPVLQRPARPSFGRRGA